MRSLEEDGRRGLKFGYVQPEGSDWVELEGLAVGQDGLAHYVETMFGRAPSNA